MLQVPDGLYEALQDHMNSFGSPSKFEATSTSRARLSDAIYIIHQCIFGLLLCFIYVVNFAHSTAHNTKLHTLKTTGTTDTDSKYYIVSAHYRDISNVITSINRGICTSIN